MKRIRDRREQKRKYNEIHREEIRERSRKYYVNHKEEIQEQQRKYRKTHKTEYRKRQQKYCDSHREEVRERNRKYQQDHKEKMLERGRKRRALKHYLQEDFTAEDAAWVRLYWDHRCAICGKTEKENGRALDIDHWKPLSKGNPLTIDNAVLMCRSCNSRKGARPAILAFGPARVHDIERNLHAIRKHFKDHELPRAIGKS